MKTEKRLKKLPLMAIKKAKTANAIKRGVQPTFYSRKFNKWFKNYENFKKYDEGTKQKYRRENAQYLQYDKQTGRLYDKRTLKYLKKPISKYKNKSQTTPSWIL